MRTKSLFFIPALLIFLIGCAGDDAKEDTTAAVPAGHETSASQNLNISILLDLSDRIDPEKNSNPSMEYYKRDLGYIETISKAFEQHLKSKAIRQINDRIQIFFEPEPLNSRINELAKALKLSFNKDNSSKAAILKISPSYITASNTIYNLAIKDKKYVGSDIWGFFKNKANDYCVEPGHRNILFILTDGYMFHEDSKFVLGPKSSYLTSSLIRSLRLNTSAFRKTIGQNGYGFIPAKDQISDLEVVVLGINPVKGNPFEGDVIVTYWENWFKEMKITRSMVKLTDLPSNLDPVIQKYINP